MRKWMLFLKISTEYWRHHKKRFLTFLSIIVLGTAALLSSSLLLRSEKQAVLDEELRLLGNYDVIIYSISHNDSNSISQNDAIKEYGKYYEIGTAMSDNGAKTNVACFDNADSEKLYHMTCTRGHYPENSNEIAIDLNTAKAMGIKPYPNEKVNIELCSYEGEVIEKKEYIISGVYELSSPSAYGGWYRYPSMMNLETAKMPGMFFHNSILDKAKSDSVTCFFQTDESDLATLCNDIVSRSDSIAWEQTDIPGGRRFAYSYVLGINDTIENKYGDSSVATIFKAMKNGDGIKDFYSGVLMPIFMVLISLVVIISILGIAGNILRDKQKGFAVLRSIGMERSSLFAMIMLDFLTLTAVFVVVGTVVGMLLHISLIKLLNAVLEIRLSFGFRSDITVNSVTYNPFLLSTITVFLCVVTATILASIKFIRLMPIKLFDKLDRKVKTKKCSEITKFKSWKRLLNSRIDMYSHSTAIICVVVMSASLFGYTYFRALSDLNNSELEYEKIEYELNDWDYKATKTDNSFMYEFNVENHHDYGIDITGYNDLIKQDFVDECFARIVNNSTRITYDLNENSEQGVTLLKEFNLRRYDNIDETSEFETALQKAENAMLENIGYGDNEAVFSIPSVGLADMDIESLQRYVIDGEIDIDRLNSGDEVIIAMSEYEYQNYISMFKAGDKLPLSDIVLNEYEELLNFGSLMPSEVSEPVYKQTVTTPEGDEVELSSYAFGKRCDIDTVIGAVVVLPDKQIMRYMKFAGEDNYGVNIFCTFKEFDAWGLPDNKLTELDIKLKPDADIGNADSYWYDILSGSKGITVRSTAEIVAQMNTGTQKTMSVYYCMIIILIILALITTAIIMYSDVRMRSSKFAVMRACGMSVGQISYLVIRQNIIYPVIGVLISIVPVSLCQRFFDYIAKMVDSEKWNFTQFEGIPWYHYVPFRYKLYDYNIPAVMAVCFAVYVVIMLVVTIPQIRYISKQSISGNIEKSDF
ncbi:MAG: FtsX-like permease family protein [Lachnospiraceae bacterium]